ncbi:MAG: RnfABCDGE type electron transport complex subunit D, partial [Candidatus Lutacidiplasmatales archaeon]
SSPGTGVPSPHDSASAPASARTSTARTPTRTAKWRSFLPVRIWKRYFPPVRLVWIFLGLLVWNADGFVSRAVAWPLLVLPIVAALTDLGLQAARFPRLRFPDAAIANGLFLSVILWPATVSLELTAVVVATVGLRHLVRLAGHPILNPAALGVTLAAVVFALPQPWHVGLTLHDTEIVAALGLILWSRAWHTWRLWATFFATNIALTLILADYLAGSSILPLVIQTSVLGAAPVFYGFFMVSEPRTAPSNRRAMLVFGALVGVSAAVFPVLFAEYPTISALGVLTPYLALFLGNIFAVALPSARGARRPASVAPSSGGSKAAGARTAPEPNA